MKVDIKGDTITITASINKELVKSKSGKSLSLFSTGGNAQTAVKHQGETVVVGLNVYIKNTAAEAAGS